jgi:hypothetical protein
METQEVRLSVSKDELEDLRTLLFQEARRGTITGGSSVAAEAKRRCHSFKRIYDQLPPGRVPDIQGS